MYYIIGVLLILCPEPTALTLPVPRMPRTYVPGRGGLPSVTASSDNLSTSLIFPRTSDTRAL